MSRPLIATPGVVDEDVEPAVLLADRLDRLGDGGAVRDVEAARPPPGRRRPSTSRDAAVSRAASSRDA